MGIARAATGISCASPAAAPSARGSGNASANTEMMVPVRFGDKVHLRNQYGCQYYLDCLNVKLNDGYDVYVCAHSARDGVPGTWVLESAEDKARGNLQFGDKIHLRNEFGNQTFLDTCGIKHGGHDIYACPSKTRDRGSGTWLVESAMGKTGDVSFGDKMHLMSQYGNQKYLDVCGSKA